MPAVRARTHRSRARPSRWNRYPCPRWRGASRRALGQIGQIGQADRAHSAPSPAVAAAVDEDPVEPGVEGGPVAQGGEARPGPHRRIVHRVPAVTLPAPSSPRSPITPFQTPERPRVFNPRSAGCRGRSLGGPQGRVYRALAIGVMLASQAQVGTRCKCDTSWVPVIAARVPRVVPGRRRVLPVSREVSLARRLRLSALWASGRLGGQETDPKSFQAPPSSTRPRTRRMGVRVLPSPDQSDRGNGSRGDQSSVDHVVLGSLRARH